MKEEFIIIKKDVLGILTKGVYLKSDLLKYTDVLNLDNTNYFKTVEKVMLDPGTRVKYDGHNYYVMQFYNNSGMDSWNHFKPMRIATARNDDFDLTYWISKSITDNRRDWTTAKSCELKSQTLYWFLNSKGEVCQAFIGDNPKADEWRQMTGNFWKTKDDAQNYRLRILEQFEDR